MQLSELLGCQAHEAGVSTVGTVIDVRLAITESPDEYHVAPTLFGLVISPRSRSSYLGYERTGVRQPTLLAALLRWRHRGTFLVLWSDIERLDGDSLLLRRGFSRYSPTLGH